MEEVKQTPAVEMVERTRIKTHPALQPRDLALLKQRERVRQEEQSEMHVHDMALLLKADPKAQLAALHLADVGGELYVVDGHHRLQAYKRAKRDQVPARLKAMTMRQASHASKLANVTHTKLEMRAAQKRNALWHHLAAITHEGANPLPVGVSQRSLQGRFGGSLDTVQRMLKRLPHVIPDEYPPEHRDGITGWPHWRYVGATARNGLYREMSPESRLQWAADKYKGHLVKLWERTDPRAVMLAHEELKREATDADEQALQSDLDAAHAVVMEEETLEF